MYVSQKFPNIIPPAGLIGQWLMQYSKRMKAWMLGWRKIDVQTHTIHGTGISTYIWLIFMVNVGKYTPYMDGTVCSKKIHPN